MALSEAGTALPNSKTAILIPLYNELTVGQVVTQFRTELLDPDICVFDNNSSDRTAEAAVKGLPLFGGGFKIETELTIKALERGYRIVEIPVDLGERSPVFSLNFCASYSLPGHQGS